MLAVCGCGPASGGPHTVDLTGCYTSTLIELKDDGLNQPHTAEHHTFCASTNTWDSYHGTPSDSQLNIEEVRVTQFDEHTQVEQHFLGWARPDWADIVDEVVIYKDGLVTDSYHLLYEYEGVVKTGEN